MSLQQNCNFLHADTISCPHCGKAGIVVWEDVSHPGGDTKEMVQVKGGFYERLAKKAPYPIELVCEGCGKAGVSPLQS